MGRFANSWETVKQSWGVLKKDRELLLFPVLSGIASLVVVLTFVAPSLAARLIEPDPSGGGGLVVAPVAILLFLALYFVLAFVTIYFNSALISAANERLGGGDPTVGSGLRGANQRIGKILAWSLFSASVSLLIKMLESATRGRRGIGGVVAHFVTQLVGVAWTLATYFAIPVVLFEDQGVIASLKRSGQLFKQRWGESLIGQYGIGFFFMAVTFLWAAVTLLPAVYLVSTGSSVAVAVALVVLFFLGALVVSIFAQALGGVYKAALYRFATQGQVSGFDAGLIQGAYVAR